MKYTVKIVERLAFNAAYSWYDSLADANGRDTEDGKRFMKIADEIRKLMNKRYKIQPVELQLAKENVETISIFELLK